MVSRKISVTVRYQHFHTFVEKINQQISDSGKNMALQLHSIILFLLLFANFYNCKPIEEDSTEFEIKIFRGQKSKDQQVSKPQCTENDFT